MLDRSDYATNKLERIEASARLCSVIVAIPVCNEAERIVACLNALDRQEGIGASELGVLLFLNNCTDSTAHVVAALQPHLRIEVRVIEREFLAANAGWARREAMEAAAEWLEDAGADEGVILTTDADSRVPADWVACNLACIAAGADAVAGRIALDPDEAARLPEALHARGTLEGTYEALLTEIEARIDPLRHDPWPRHWTTSGATLAVRLTTYRKVGGMPALAVGEDRAFVSALLGSDARVRHDPNIVVVTSGRLEGRAPGGAADTMKLRCEVPESPCDPRLEPLARALFRFYWGRRLRRLHAVGQIQSVHLWAPWLGIDDSVASAIARLTTFGLMHAGIARISPRLTFHPLRPRELPTQIRRARLVLSALRVYARLCRFGRAPRAAKAGSKDTAAEVH